MIFLKLDGKLITKGPFSMDWDNLNRLVEEIGDLKEKMIVFHGADNFGKHVINEYGGTSEGYVKAREATLKFSMYVVSTFTAKNISVATFSPSSFLFASNGKVKEKLIYPIQEAFEDFIPLLHGDPVIDAKNGFTFFSAEEVMIELIDKIKPRKILIATDVPEDLIKSKVETIKDSNFKTSFAQMRESTQEKVLEWGKLSARCGCPVILFDGRRKGELEKAQTSEAGITIRIKDEGLLK